jgi:transcriptional regulator with XRE-family HTH domain
MDAEDADDFAAGFLCQTETEFKAKLEQLKQLQQALPFHLGGGRCFIRHSGITQGRLCRHLGVSDSSLSQFLSGKAGLDPSVLIKLCQTLSLSHREIATKFSQPVTSAKILSLQDSHLRWVGADADQRSVPLRSEGISGSLVTGCYGESRYVPLPVSVAIQCEPIRR